MKFFLQFFMALHVGLYRLTKGKFAGKMGNNQVLLLTTTGRKSGKTRTIPLGFFEWQGSRVIVASNGGADSHPGWFFNLKNNPRVTVEVFDQTIPVQAEILSGEERAQAWQQVITTSPPYAKYSQTTTREIPVVRLRPI